jgi:ATP-dependent Clp protease ATP-binding subunit ClpB
LSEADISAIVTIQLAAMERRLAARRLGLVVTDAAVAWLGHRGYDPAYGARPLKRLIQRQIADRLALALLEGNFPEGSTVTVDAVPPIMASDGSIEPADGLLLR